MADQKPSSAKQRQSKNHVTRYTLQYERTAANKLRRIMRHGGSAGGGRKQETYEYHDKKGNLMVMYKKMAVSWGRKKAGVK